MSKTFLWPVALAVFLGSCGNLEDFGQSKFSTCFAKRIEPQVQYCLAEDTQGDFHREVGKRYVVYGYYNEMPWMVKEGISRCQPDQQAKTNVNACTAEEITDYVSRILPESPQGVCGATIDPRENVLGC